MRINITHSIDLSEIPEHLLEMMNKKIDLDGIQELYTDICKNLNPNASSNTVRFCSEQIIEMRKILFKIDTTLQDCTGILNNYSEMLENTDGDKQQEVEVTSEPSSSIGAENEQG